jgi:glucosamine-6-phosphate deaminase
MEVEMQSEAKPIREKQYGQAQVEVFYNGTDLGVKAAHDLAAILKETLADKGEASIIVATGNSQLQFMAALREIPAIDWSKVRVFHMDEYVGMSDTHPASFRLYIREKLTDIVRPLAFYGVEGDAPDLEAELERYTNLLERYPADACVMGIGENGHLAFNDPPADFDTDETIHVVELDQRCRMQQVGEGHFRTIDDVPKQALSLTVPALIKPPHVLVVVPEQRKAEAVKAALEGPVTPNCPASILQRQANATIYLDRESSSLLSDV